MSLLKTAFAALAGSPARDVNGAEARNGLVQIVSLSLTKCADALINPKLTLAWLLASLGASGAVIGLLTPVREAGSLLPQLALARWVEQREKRKLVWVAGAAMQGLAAAGMGLAALTLDGAFAGWSIVCCLAALAVARSLCSLSHKDTLARSIAKSRRGAVSGAAGGLAAAVTLAFGATLAIGVIPLTVSAISIAILVAGALWFIGAAFFLALDEENKDGSADENHVSGLFGPLGEDPMLRRFIAARAMLTVTALAPPFILLASSIGSNDGAGVLGPLFLASSAAAIISSYVWGRLSDRSSRKTMMAAAGLSSASLAAGALCGFTTGGLGGVAGAAAVLFFAQIAYEGVRQGRKLHLTDMTNDANRARYTALSNTLIGVVLLLGGVFGLIADALGPLAVLALFSAIAALSVPVLAGLDEVQSD